MFGCVAPPAARRKGVSAQALIDAPRKISETLFGAHVDVTLAGALVLALLGLEQIGA